MYYSLPLLLLTLGWLESSTAICTSKTAIARACTWPSDLTTPFPFDTNTPLNIETENVRPVNATPLVYTVAQSQSFTINNTGYTIRIRYNQPNPAVSITGGVLGTDGYVFEMTRFFWNDAYNSLCCFEIDGYGAPIYMNFYLYNKKYGSYVNAFSKRDGLLIFAVPIFVEGYIPNPSFRTLEGIMRNVTKPGSVVVQPGTLPLFSFLEEVTSKMPFYYAYPASYVDIENNDAVYFCATLITPPKYVAPVISIDQFRSAFQSLRNLRGTSLSNVISNFEQGCTPVVQASGVIVNILPYRR